MANIKSAIKRIKVSEKNAARNRAIKSQVKTAIKKFDNALAEGDVQSAKDMYPGIISSIDKATAKGIYHKNTAGHTKSKLAKKLSQAQ